MVEASKTLPTLTKTQIQGDMTTLSNMLDEEPKKESLPVPSAVSRGKGWEN